MIFVSLIFLFETTEIFTCLSLLALEEIRCQFGAIPFLRIYMEYANLLNGVPLFHQPGTNIALIFVKLFDPVAQTLRYNLLLLSCFTFWHFH